MWDILAVKAGEVWLWKDDVPTCYEPSCWRDQPVGNYIVLRDRSTNPVTYQLYLHLKQDSIPDDIKVKGFGVAQGQFIGVVDNTGQSSGSHLHFQVQVPLYGDNYYWGRSVDITFDDVSVNGGRPRIHNSRYCLDFNYCGRPGDVCKTSQLYYISQNQRVYPEDSTPPTGDIISPSTGETHTIALPLEGLANDLGDGDSTPSGLRSAQFIVNYNGDWTEIGPEFNEPTFTYDWDWCAAEVPNGPVSVALRLIDNRGNQAPGLPGLQHVIKHFDCLPQPPPPNCQPSANQVAIFTEIDYLGDCQILNIGNYANSTSFDPVGGNNTHSILVGSSVQAELFTGSNFSGRTEILQANDANLSDNPTGGGTLSSLRVSTRNSPLGISSPPILPLAPVMASSIASSNTTFTAPYSTALENGTDGWTFETNSLWHLSTTASHSADHSFRYADQTKGNYDTGSANAGILESPIIRLPVSQDVYVLQFWYRYATESSYTHWDQRRILISVDGGDYTEIHQFTDDPMLGWIQARIDLLPFYGDMDREHIIRLRFHFDTVDKHNNAFEGWFIDDFQIEAEPVRAIICPDDYYEPNDIPNDAKKLAYGKTADAAICHGTDLDYFRFEGSARDRVVVDIDAKSKGSDVDGYLFLLDSDGRSVLAESDDEILYKKQDPLLGYMLPRNGLYYLKFQAWDHPMGVGEYSLNLLSDHQNPSITLQYPAEDSSIPPDQITLTAQATDAESSVRYVQFMVHKGNWETGKWIELGTDYDGSDGWSAILDASSLPDGEIISVYATAYDWAGNWDHDAAWNVKVDSRSFILYLTKLLNPAQSTGQHLQWTAAGSGSENALVTLQQRTNNGQWLNLLTNSALREYWFIGQANNSYTFRVSTQDPTGNQVTDQTNTSIPAAATLCSQPDPWDASASVNDNDYTNATPISAQGGGQTHNFCNPAATDYLNDEDWFSFSAKEGKSYTLVTDHQGGAAVIIRFYAADGTTLLAESVPTAFEQATALHWDAVKDGIIYVQLLHSDGRIAGNGVSYSVTLGDELVFLPATSR
jgi:hypothetical protein